MERTNYLPRGIEASGGLQPWMDHPRQVARHNGLGYGALVVRIERGDRVRWIMRDYDMKSDKPVKAWIARYWWEKEQKNAKGA